MTPSSIEADERELKAGRGGLACGEDGCRTLTEAEASALWESAKKSQRERAERLPDVQTAIRAIHDGYRRLEELGWKNPIYCPKDGTRFQAIEAGSTGIHRCYYDGKWPDGSWWIEDGDTWPSRPILFKPYDVAALKSLESPQ